jgi:hypothetical protein
LLCGWIHLPWWLLHVSMIDFYLFHM